MAKIFITGSSDGIGLLAAKSLIQKGHQVVLHARNEKRKNEILANVDGAPAILVGDLSETEQTIKLAEQANKLGRFDAVIHNAGVYNNASAEQILSVNVLAPYILTCLMQKPGRLVYVSSSMHLQGQFKRDNLKDNVQITYSDSKLLLLMLCKAIARKWTDVFANAIDPGWVPTKMGGSGAPDDLQKGYETQVWLAVTNAEAVKFSGRYLFHQKEQPYNKEADSVASQDKLLEICKEITNVSVSGPMDK